MRLKAVIKKQASIWSVFLGLIFLPLSSSSLLENGYSCTEKNKAYTKLKNTNGSGVALKYWMFHLNTIQVVSVITIIAIAMPDLYQSLKIWDQDNFHDFSEEQKNEAKRIVKDT